MTEDEKVEWHHQLDGHEFEQAVGAVDRQGSLACCSPWGHRELDKTERLIRCRYLKDQLLSGLLRRESGMH